MLPRRVERWLFAFVVLGAPFQFSTAHAVDRFWRLPGGGTFSSTGAWFGSIVPNVNDVAAFGLSTNPLAVPETYTVQFTGDASTKALRVEDDRVTFDLNGHTYSPPAPFAVIEIGTVNGAQARLTITDGLVHSAGPVILGENGGTGRLVVPSSGRLESSGSSLVGFGSGGIAEVTGTGVWDNVGELTVGSIAGGTLTISGGGLVVSDSAVVGLHASGSATVTGASSKLAVGPLSVGRNATGTLDIIADGEVQSLSVLIGSEAAGNGTVTVSGASSRWRVNDSLGIGVNSALTADAGAGTVRIQTGGAVLVGEDVVLGNGDALHLEGGYLNTDAIEFVGAAQPFFWTSGTLVVNRIDGNLTVPDGGVLTPNKVPGTHVLGSYMQVAGSRLEIDIFGASAADSVLIDGAATFGGNLRLQRGAMSLLPTPTETYSVLEAVGGITSSFDNVANGGRLALGGSFGSFRVNYGPDSALGAGGVNEVILDAFQPGANFNGDLIVDAADLAIWKTKFGMTTGATNTQGDADGDGDVDGADFLVWQRQNGLSLGSTSAAVAATIPEPSCVVLMLAALAVVHRPASGLAISRRR